MPIIREAVLEDAKKVAALQYKFGIGPDTEDDWKRLWVDNPAKHTDIPIGWVLEENDELVGFLGNVSRSYELGEEKIKAVAARGWVVEPSARNMTVLLLSKYLNQKNVDILLNSSSNDTAYQIFGRMGSKTVPLDVYAKLLFWVTHEQNFITSVAAYFHLPTYLNRLLGSVGGFLFKFPNLFILHYMKRKISSLSHQYEMRLIEPNSIGVGFDELWGKKKKEQLRFLADRSATALRWHFSKQEFKTRLICCYENGELKGYLALAKMQNGKTAFIRHVVIDLIALGDTKSIIEFMIANAYQLSRSENIVALELLGFTEEIRDVIYGMKVLKRKSFPTPFTFKLVDKQLSADEFSKKQTWYPSLFDGDSSL